MVHCRRADVLHQIVVLLGADADAVDEHFITPLHLAAGEGKLDLCQLLIENGAKVARPEFATRVSVSHCPHDDGSLSFWRLTVRSSLVVLPYDSKPLCIGLL